MTRHEFGSRDEPARRVAPRRGRLHFGTVLFGGAMLAAAGCAPSTTATPASAADITRDARLLRMTDMRVLDTALVDDLLRDRDPARRARAALAIGQVKGRARYATLRRLLVDPDTAVAANAAFALGLVKDTAAIVTLARAVAGAPDPVAIAAAWSLGDIGDAARSVLTVALGDGLGQPLAASTAAQRSPAVRAALLTATSKLRATPTSVVVPWLSDNDPVVVRAAAYVIQRTRSAGGVRALLALRASSDEETRQHVARALAKPMAGDSLGARAVEALRVLMTDASARVRVNAVRSLASYGAPSKDAVLAALKDPDGNVRVATSELVGALLGADAAGWRAAWAIDTTLPVRITLMGAARRAGTTALAPDENAWVTSSDWRQRAAALRSRTDSLHPPKLDDVAWALRDADGRVREAGVAATRGVVRATPALADSMHKVWRSMLSDADYGVRSAAAAALRANASAADLEPVVDAYARAAADREADARMAALSLIASIWQRDSSRVAPALRARIAALAPPADSGEREAGRNVSLLSSWKTARSPSTARSVADYEAVVRRYVAPSARRVTAVIHTERGDIGLELFGHDAPMTVDNFVQLATRGYYRNTQFHRVVPNFVAQDGDPRGDGSGGPGYAIRDELTRDVHERGTLAMALSGPDTGGSQYYLCHSPQPHLDGHYTVFGHITSGYDVLDRIVQGDRIMSIEIR